MKDRDHKKLEIIYESLSENFLIKEENIFVKEYSKYLAVNIVHEVARFQKQIDENPQQYFPCTMYNFFWLYVKEIPKDILSKMNLDSDTSNWVAELYEIYVIKDMTHENAEATIVKGTVYLNIKSPFNKKKQTIISLKEDVNIIASKLEECFKQFIRFVFTNKRIVQKLEKEEFLETWVGKGFAWRKKQAKFQKIKDRLPELEGVFESKNEYVGFLKLTFKNLSKEDMDIILKYGQESMEPHLFEINPISDSSICFIEKAETKEAYQWFIKELKNHLVEYKHSLASSLYHAPWTPIKTFRQAQAFVKRIFTNCEAKVLKSEYQDLVKRLPELEGIF